MSAYNNPYQFEETENDLYQFESSEPEPKKEPKPRKFVFNNPPKERNIFGVPQAEKKHMFAEAAEITKGALSGLSFGASEQITPKQIYGPLSYMLPKDWLNEEVTQSDEKILSEDPNVPGFEVGKLLGALPFLEGAGVPIVNSFKAAAAKSPIFPKVAESLSRLTGWGTVGAIEAGAKDLAKGEYPDPEHMIENAATYSILDGGLQLVGKAFQFTKSLFSKAKTTGEPIFSVLEKTIDELDTPDPAKPQDLVQRAFDILEEGGKRLKPLPRKVPIEPISQNGKSQITLPKSPVEEAVNEYAPRYNDKKAFGEGLQETLEGNFQKEKEAYTKFYKGAENASSEALLTPEESAKKVADAVMDVQKFKTKPTGYEKFEKDAVKFLEDAGYTVQKDLQTGKISEILAPAKGSNTLTAKDSIELSRRISEFVDYEAVEPSIKKVWGSVAKSLKEEAKVALGKVSPEALKSFEKAERLYEDTAKKYGKDAVKGARYTELPSDTAKMLTHPDKIAHLKDVLTPDQFKIVEREVLEALSEEADPAKVFREVKKQLSPEAQAIGEKIVGQKALEKAVGKTATLQELKQLVKDPKTRALIEERGGQGTAKFIEDLPDMQKKLELFSKNAENNPENFKKTMEAFYKTRPAQRIEGAAGEALKGAGEKAKGYAEQQLQRIQKSRHPVRQFFTNAFEAAGMREHKASKWASQILGVPHVGKDILTTWWWNPRLRRSFSDMIKKQGRDPLTFYAAVQQFAEDVADEEATQSKAQSK